MPKLLLSLILLAATAAASAADSPKDVQALIARGDYPGAEAALREAITEHPQSAKAHYVLAEVLAHEGNIGEARAEANKAAALDPATRFTNPATFQAFQQKLDQALAPAATRTNTAPVRYAAPREAGARESGGGFGLGGIVLVGLVIAVVAFLWSRRRRATDAPFPGYGQVPPPPPSSPYGGGPGYPGYAPPPSSGMGSTIAAGVGGLAAGMLLDEALRSRHEGDASRDASFLGGAGAAPPPSDPSGDAYNDLRDDPIDMGNDDTSWDTGGSSDDGGSFDDNQW
jgi:hypothetical protein